jgi:hypothetical protein
MLPKSEYRPLRDACCSALRFRFDRLRHLGHPPLPHFYVVQCCFRDVPARRARPFKIEVGADPGHFFRNPFSFARIGIVWKERQSDKRPATLPGDKEHYVTVTSGNDN